MLIYYYFINYFFSYMTRKNWGVLCIVGPFLLLILTLIAYGVASFILAATGYGANSLLVANIIRAVLGLLGVISVLTIVPGIVVGIALLLKK